MVQINTVRKRLLDFVFNAIFFGLPTKTADFISLPNEFSYLFAYSGFFCSIATFQSNKCPLFRAINFAKFIILIVSKQPRLNKPFSRSFFDKFRITLNACSMSLIAMKFLHDSPELLKLIL